MRISRVWNHRFSAPILHAIAARGEEVAALELREVVTVFLWHGGQVLLLRRSQRVGTYRGRWAGVSGFLEGEPLAQALAELREETSLEPGDVTILKQGAPLEVMDRENQRAWRVHPFLAEVKDPAKIRLDWENTEMRWIFPEEIGALETVPALDEALRRVLP